MKAYKIFLVVTLFWQSAGYASDSAMNINDVTAMAVIKFSQFDARLKARAGSLVIYVMGQADISKSLEQIKSRLPKSLKYQVLSGSKLPDSPPDILFIGKGDIKKALAYTQSNRVLSVTNDKNIFKQGAAIGIWEIDNKIGVNLNTSQSISEGANWQFDYSKIGNLTIEFRGNF